DTTESETLFARRDNSAAAATASGRPPPPDFPIEFSPHRGHALRGVERILEPPRQSRRIREARMRNVWIGSVAALALACTVGIGAQTTASPATSSNQAASDTITVTGCLKAADAMGSATGTSGSTTAGSSSTASTSDRFMLANATTGAATTASTGTAGSSTAGST